MGTNTGDLAVFCTLPLSRGVHAMPRREYVNMSLPRYFCEGVSGRYPYSRLHRGRSSEVRNLTRVPAKSTCEVDALATKRCCVVITVGSACHKHMYAANALTSQEIRVATIKSRCLDQGT